MTQNLTRSNADDEDGTSKPPSPCREKKETLTGHQFQKEENPNPIQLLDKALESIGSKWGMPDLRLQPRGYCRFRCSKLTVSLEVQRCQAPDPYRKTFNLKKAKEKRGLSLVLRTCIHKQSSHVGCLELLRTAMQWNFLVEQNTTLPGCRLAIDPSLSGPKTKVLSKLRLSLCQSQKLDGICLDPDQLLQSIEEFVLLAKHLQTMLQTHCNKSSHQQSGFAGDGNMMTSSSASSINRKGATHRKKNVARSPSMMSLTSSVNPSSSINDPDITPRISNKTRETSLHGSLPPVPSLCGDPLMRTGQDLQPRRQDTSETTTAMVYTPVGDGCRESRSARARFKGNFRPASTSTASTDPDSSLSVDSSANLSDPARTKTLLRSYSIRKRLSRKPEKSKKEKKKKDSQAPSQRRSHGLFRQWSWVVDPHKRESKGKKSKARTSFDAIPRNLRVCRRAFRSPPPRLGASRDTDSVYGSKRVEI